MKTASLARIRRKWTLFVRRQQAATAIEYALIAAGIALAIVTVVGTLGGGVSGLFQTVATGLAGLVN